jgi:hypothetical protein
MGRLRISAVIRNRICFVQGARELYPALGTAMSPDIFRLLENLLVLDDTFKPESELEALMKAKARQDRTCAKFDKWIAATIAELRDAKRLA